MTKRTADVPYRLFICVLLTLANSALALEFGVGTHFGQGRGNPSFAFQWMKSAGMTSFRDEVYWSNLEFQPGKFTPDNHAQLSLQAFQTAKSQGLNPVLILSYGNPLYDEGSQPYSSTGRKAFVSYARWVLGQLHQKVEYVEIWNEWNLGAGAAPEKSDRGNPLEYVKLANETYDAIKQENPDIKIIVGALGDDLNDWSWLKEAIQAGLLKKADGVSVHLYNHSMSKDRAGAHEIISRLQSLQTLLKANNGGVSIPIYVTETGWPTDWGWSGVSERIAAEQNTRLLLESYTVENLAGIWWYELVDGGDNPLNREHRFGLIDTKSQEKIAGCRLKSLLPFIIGAKLIQHLNNGNVEALLFKGSTDKSLLAVWTGQGYAGNSTAVELKGVFGQVKPFDKACGDRIATGLINSAPHDILINAHSYPTLTWVDQNANITHLELK